MSETIATGAEYDGHTFVIVHKGTREQKVKAVREVIRWRNDPNIPLTPESAKDLSTGVMLSTANQ